MATDNMGINLNRLINAVNELDKIYIVTGIETPDNVLKQLGDIKAYTMELLGGYYELTENYNAQTAVIGFFEADNKQLDGQLKEAKRLLSLVLSDVNTDSCCANCYSCKHLGGCDHSDRYEWRHTDEVEKLLNG